MNVQYVNAFVDSVTELFAKMLQSEVLRENVRLVGEKEYPYDMVSFIGLSGGVCGTVALSLSKETAEKMVARLLGAEIDGDESAIIDDASELVNMIAGNAKAKLAEKLDISLELSLPSVVKGEKFTFDHPSRASWVEVPFQSDLGDFRLQIGLEQT